MSGKEEFQQEIPLPPQYEGEQQELEQTAKDFDEQTTKSTRLLDMMNQQIKTFCNQQKK